MYLVRLPSGQILDADRVHAAAWQKSTPTSQARDQLVVCLGAAVSLRLDARDSWVFEAFLVEKFSLTTLEAPTDPDVNSPGEG